MYERIEVACDLSGLSLQDAALKIGPAFVYDLHISTNGDVMYYRDFVKQLAANVQNNPLAPYINLILDENLGRFEWFLSANGRAVGSEGA